MTVKKGDKVKVDYIGKFEDGSIFDSSTHGDHSNPLEFEVGSGQIIKGFDEAVIGMNIADEKKIKLSHEEAYGEINPQLIQNIPKNMIPESEKLKPGMMLMAGTPDGHQFPVRIVEILENEIKVDMNHPLAGKNLIFEIKLVAIN